MMDMEKLMEFATAKGVYDRIFQGQTTLKYLRDVLRMLPRNMTCIQDTGHNFGNARVRWERVAPYVSDDDPEWNRPSYDIADSEHSYPSCYRGYYSDCTFNAHEDYPESTVGHLLDMINDAIGKTFDGYKGGLNTFTENTLVWGGWTSHSSTGDSRMITGIEVVVRDGEKICVIKTEPEDKS